MKNSILLSLVVMIFVSCKKGTTTNTNLANNANVSLNTCNLKGLAGKVYGTMPTLEPTYSLFEINSGNKRYIFLSDTMSSNKLLHPPQNSCCNDVYIEQREFSYTEVCSKYNNNYSACLGTINLIWEEDPDEYLVLTFHENGYQNSVYSKKYFNDCYYTEKSLGLSVTHSTIRFKEIKTSLDSIYRIEDYWCSYCNDTIPFKSDTTKWYYIPNPPK